MGNSKPQQTHLSSVWKPLHGDAVLRNSIHLSLIFHRHFLGFVYRSFFTLIPQTAPPPSLLFLTLMLGSVPHTASGVPAALRSLQPAGPLTSSSARLSPCQVDLGGGPQIVNDSPPLSPLPSAPLLTLFFNGANVEPCGRLAAGLGPDANLMTAEPVVSLANCSSHAVFALTLTLMRGELLMIGRVRHCF